VGTAAVSGRRARRRALGFVLAGVLLAAGPVCVGAVEVAPAAASDRIFRQGERLVYDVTWMGIKAGQATLEARGVVPLNGHAAYHLVTTAQSTPLISRFFRVDDRSDSFLAVHPLQSLRFEKQLREGRYRHNSQTAFDHDAKVATFRYLDFGPVPKHVSSLEEAERFGTYVSQEFPLSPGALDELSVLYYVRTLPLGEGRTVVAKVFASKKNWDLEVNVLRRETVDTVLGPRQTFLVEPLLKFEGIFQQKGRVLVWVTADTERIPVLMKSEVKIGSFVSTLARREVGTASGNASGAPGPGR
jgi:hypothetical protein